MALAYIYTFLMAYTYIILYTANWREGKDKVEQWEEKKKIYYRRDHNWPEDEAVTSKRKEEKEREKVVTEGQYGWGRGFPGKFKGQCLERP